MSRLRFTYYSLGLIVALSLLGIFCAPAVYHIWIVERWGADWGDVVTNYSDQLRAEIAYPAPEVDFWWPVRILIAVLLAPVILVFLRIRQLGWGTPWICVALLPGLNVVFLAWLATQQCKKSPGSGNGSRKWPHVLTILALLWIAGGLCYYLMLYLPWLAAKS